MREAPVSTRNQVTASRPDTRLRGRWLVVARVLWIALVGLSLILLGIALPEFYQSARTISMTGIQEGAQLTAEDARLLQQWGVSLGAYAAFKTAQIAIFSLVCTAAAALIFWHKSVDRIALFVSLWFPVVGVTATPLLVPLINAHSMWQLPIIFLISASLGCFPILTYIFPDGQFVPSWTRALTIAWIVWIVISPFTPFGVGASASSGPSPLWFVVLIPGGMIIGILAQIYRYLRVSSRVERQQTKWMLFGFSVMAIVFILANLPPLVMPSVLEPGLIRVFYLTLGGEFLGIIAFCVWFLCIGIAIQRYRLWDIDRLINRTLVYGALTTTLGAVYLGGVVVLQALFVRLTGQESTLAVVASTLVIAALFQPLRAWVQGQVDKRFDRTRYNARLVLEQFAARAQQEAELDTLSADLLATVDDALKPEKATLWLARPHDAPGGHSESG